MSKHSWCTIHTAFILVVVIVDAAKCLSHTRRLMSTRSVNEAAADVGANEAINVYIKSDVQLKTKCVACAEVCVCV